MTLVCATVVTELIILSFNEKFSTFHKTSKEYLIPVPNRLVLCDTYDYSKLE